MSKKHAPTAHARKRKGKKRIWERHPEDWYVEPDWVNDRLFANEPFDGPVHDPACGEGRIVMAARRAGLRATGCDIVKRAPGFKVGNFFERTHHVANIACNVPFRFALAFVAHALAIAERKVAVLLPATWVNAEARSRWLARTPLRRIWQITPRPSMPPGNVVLKQKSDNGTGDFVWLVFEHGYAGRPELGWLRRGDAPVPKAIAETG
jgi:hypothetical protein